MIEARIRIGNRVLTVAQSMVVRIAVISFGDELATRRDHMAEAYKARLQEVMTLLLKDIEKNKL